MEIDEDQAGSRGPVRNSPKQKAGRDSDAGGSPPGVGAMLREARDDSGLTVLDVAQRLFLTEHYVQALEANDYDKLPGEVYVKGYIKSYARLLRLDAKRVMDAYRRPGAPVFDDDGAGPLRTAPARSDRNWMVPLLLLLLLVGAVAAAWWVYQAFGAGAGAGFLAVGAVMQGAKR